MRDHVTTHTRPAAEENAAFVKTFIRQGMELLFCSSLPGELDRARPKLLEPSSR